MSYASRLLRRAEKLHAQGKIKKAVPLYQQAIALDPRPETIYACGLALIAMRDFAGGCKFLEYAVQYDPDSVTCWYNLGMSYDAQGKLEDAMRCYLKALEFRPEFILAHSNLGSVYYRLGENEKGYYHHTKALEPETDNDEDKAGRALIRLLRGDYERGWQEYESRWTLPMVMEVNPVPTTGKRWYGEPLEGKPLLIFHEQGLGDSLMMVRFVESIAFQNPVVLMVQPSLKKLIAWTFRMSDVKVIERGEPHEFYWYCPMMSLAAHAPYDKPPRYLLPYEMPGYDLPDPEPHHKLTVGIYWQGSRHHMNDKDRSCPFSEFRKLFQVKGVRWVSLQTPPEPNTLDTIKGATIYEMGFDDFTETAAAVEQCDLVITVDSAVGHLAGAMGKRTWLITPTAPEFRWGLDPDSTPWYPNHKLYRRKNWKAWPELMARIKTDLQREVDGA